MEAYTTISLILHTFGLFLKKANVMLEYDIDEAQSLLEKNLATASRNLESLEEDLDFLRDQFTTTEVSILTPSVCMSLKLKSSRCFELEMNLEFKLFSDWVH